MNQGDNIELQIEKLLAILVDPTLDDLSKKKSFKEFLSEHYIEVEEHRVICRREFRRGRNHGMGIG